LNEFSSNKLLAILFSLFIVGDMSTRLAIQTLEEMEWCLDQLEKMQTHRSVADMATSKVTETRLPKLDCTFTISVLIHRYKWYFNIGL